MKDASYIRDEIGRVLSKARQVQQTVGTMTDCMVLDIYGNVDLLPPVTSQDLTILKRVVDTGVVVDANFRRPKGPAVYAFMLYLKNKQEEAILRRIFDERRELESLFEGVWARALQAHGGDTKNAKEDFARKWGGTRIESYTRTIFNNAYKLAIKKWNSEKNGDSTAQP